MASLLRGLSRLPSIGQSMMQMTLRIPPPHANLLGPCGSTRLLSSLTCINAHQCCGERRYIPGTSMLLTSNSLSHSLYCFSPMVQPCRTYKVKMALKRRCSSCYFVRRQGRLFVECKSKPRHKQMQKIGKHKLWREDYSKGRIEEAMTWNWRHDRFYWLGDNKFAKYNWVDGKIGHTV